MFGFDWTGDGSVDFVDDLITLSMLGALDDEASDEDDEEDEDDWRLSHGQKNGWSVQRSVL